MNEKNLDWKRQYTQYNHNQNRQRKNWMTRLKMGKHKLQIYSTWKEEIQN